jgi:hypothetical protein
MNQSIECKTQEEFDKAIKGGDIAIVREGIWTAYGSAQVTAYGSAQVTAYDSAQVTASDSAQVRAYDSARVTAYDSAQVTAYGSAQVTAYGSAQVTAYDSAQVRASGSAQVRAYDSAQVTAYGSAQVTAYGSAQVTAYGSAQVTAYGSAQVTAYDSAQVRASGSAQVTAYGYVAITQHADTCRITSTRTCQIIKVPAIKDIEDYLSRYPIQQEGDSVILYKAVNPSLKSLHSNTPITYPKKGVIEQEEISPPEDGCCAKGLHFAHFDWAVSFGQQYSDFVLLKARIPKDKIVVSPDCDGKVRTSYAEIIEVIKDWQHYKPEI